MLNDATLSPDVDTGVLPHHVVDANHVEFFKRRRVNSHRVRNRVGIIQLKRAKGRAHGEKVAHVDAARAEFKPFQCFEIASRWRRQVEVRHFEYETGRVVRSKQGR